jgi:hypothetical protein
VHLSCAVAPGRATRGATLALRTSMLKGRKLAVPLSFDTPLLERILYNCLEGSDRPV